MSVRHPSETQDFPSRVLQAIQVETLPATGSTCSSHIGEPALNTSQATHAKSQATVFPVVNLSNSWLRAIELAIAHRLSR